MASRLSTFYGTKRGRTAYEERIAREKEAQRQKDIAAEKDRRAKMTPEERDAQRKKDKAELLEGLGAIGKKLDFKDSSPADKPAEKTSKDSYKGKLGGTQVSVDGETKKDEDKEKDWAHQKEMQDQAHQNALELQQNTQRFQDEQRQKTDAEWYARRDYIRSQKDRSVKWNFRSNSSGGRTSSKWTIDVLRGADRASPGGIGGRITPGENGQIGIAARGPDGKSSLTMNGPSIQGRRIGGGLVDRSGGDTNDTKTNDINKPGLPSFKFSVPFKTNTEAQNLTKDALTEKQLPTDIAMREGFLSGDRLAATLETAASASRNGAKVSIGYGALQALKPGTKIMNEDGATRESKPGGQEVVNKTITFNPSKDIVIGDKNDPNVQKAISDQNAVIAQNSAAASKPFSVSDFTQRKQGRDGKYYDA